MTKKLGPYFDYGAALIALGLSFAADAAGFELSDDTVWLLRIFAGGAVARGAFGMLTRKDDSDANG